MSNELSQFENLLKQEGYFVTRSRKQLFLLLQNNAEVTIKQLISLLTTQDQATVYRNIQLFEKLGIIHHVRLGWNSKLELSDLFRPHHHHASCGNCGRIVALHEDAELEQKINNLVSGDGFLVQSHSLEIRGLCKNCKK